MITHEALVEQLQRIDYNPNGWGRTEVNELCNILMPDEEIEELVNGYYEAGFALLVATKDRVLLVDKKPLNYLTVEDMRFDMISEFDYSHRIIGAHVSITSGNKSLSFTSLNQQRLRRLLTYVQARMTDIKKTLHNQQETQQQHLEQMNEQLRQYLVTAQQAQKAQQMQSTQVATYGQAVPPQYSATDGYLLPVPQPVVPQLISSQESFERAAAASVGLDQSPTQSTATSVFRKIVLTPQQVGIAGMRRVVPVLLAYGRSAQPVKN